MYRIKTLLCCLALLLCCQACHKGYTIKGTVSGDDLEGKSVTLLELRGIGSPAEVQKTTIQNGSFTMKGVVAYPDLHLLYIDGQGPVEFFVENSNISLTVSLDSLDGAEINGSASQMEYERFYKSIKPYQDRMEEIAEEADARAAAIDSMPRPESPEMTDAEWTAYTDTLKQAVNDSLSLLLREAAMNGKFFIYDWIKSNSDSYVAAFLAYEMAKNTSAVDEISGLCEALANPSVRKSQWVRLLNTHLRYLTRTVEGATYTDFTMPSWNGGDVTLSDYVGKKQFVVLYFWASWNPKSRELQKTLIPLYEKYKDQGVEIVSVSLDRQFEDWDLALKEDSIPWVQLSSLKYWQTDAVELYNVNEIPQTFVINNEGTILLRIKDPSELHRNFEQVFHETPADSIK